MYIYVYVQNFHFKILTLSRQKLKVYKDIGIRIFIILEIIRMSINKRLVKYNVKLYHKFMRNGDRDLYL